MVALLAEKGANIEAQDKVRENAYSYNSRIHTEIDIFHIFILGIECIYESIYACVVFVYVLSV